MDARIPNLARQESLQEVCCTSIWLHGPVAMIVPVVVAAAPSGAPPALSNTLTCSILKPADDCWPANKVFVNDWPYVSRRSGYETGLGDPDRNTDSYFDPQFLGATDAFPFAANAGLSISWKLRWVPWLCKKHPRGGAPIKSECFCLGGVDPLQVGQ